ncbi:transcription initiation factor TFIID subunit 8 [Coemansia guatemalensis]|uniref:Transcription initiation factor TFIID subunit 8 n=1 Tax=Coemansia guatemalensis TaxID=2761395 RepID=A0A9W8LV13_9FUNG|nr:transcription initiation factor TFIID subunit 8 [Coemansia guatemalensis]
MSGSASDAARQQLMRRALSVVLQNTDFDAVSANALDILCTVSILYIQNMLSQVHAYAEHATRTRPNMNDVGRALEERSVTAAQLDAYYHDEMGARQQPSVATAIDQLHRQATALTDYEQPGMIRASSRSGVFFGNTAEDLLRKLVEYHKDRRALLSMGVRGEDRSGGQRGDVDDSDAMAARSTLESTQYTNPGKNVEGNGKDDRVTMGSNDDEDDDGEEDADFEAPDVSSIHLHYSEATARGDAETIQSPQVLDGEEQAPGNRASDEEAIPADSAVLDDGPPPGAGRALGSVRPSTSPQPKDPIEDILLPPSILPEHIPPQCPLFPSPHTYRQTPVFPKREQDFFRTRMHKAEQSRQAEENLQRLISGPYVAGGAVAVDSSSIPDTASGSEQHGSDDIPGNQDAQFGHRAHKRIMHLFPPANFRDVRKRTRLADFIK